MRYLFVLLLLLTGCVSASSKIVTGIQRTPISPTLVKIYSSPPANFEEIAIIEASSKSSWAGTDQGKTDVVVQRLKDEAASVGANGVLLNALGTESTSGVMFNSQPGKFGTGVYASAQHKTGKAIAIYVKE